MLPSRAPGVARIRITGAALLASAVLTLGCSRSGAVDTVSDVTLDAAVWREDGDRILGALPKVLASFKPSEAASSFSTSYSTGPVFGAACTYADGPRQLVLRIESGNIRERAAARMKGTTTPGESFVTREVTVHGQKGAVHWSGVGRSADVVFVVQQRFLVELRLVPAATQDEAVQLAEGMNLGPLEALTLAGVQR